MPGAQAMAAVVTDLPARRARSHAAYDGHVERTSADARDAGDIDARLLVRMAAGDQAALGDLYGRYGRMLHAIAFRITGDAQAAEECTQDAFMAAWRTARTFDPGRAQPSTWLCAIARNRALDAVRGQSRRPTPQEEVQPTGTAPDTADVVADADAAVRVGEALARLPQEQLDVLQLGYFDGLSQSEIADRLALPLGTVKSRMRLALGRMRDVARDLGLEA